MKGLIKLKEVVSGRYQTEPLTPEDAAFALHYWAKKTDRLWANGSEPNDHKILDVINSMYKVKLIVETTNGNKQYITYKEIHPTKEQVELLEDVGDVIWALAMSHGGLNNFSKSMGLTDGDTSIIKRLLDQRKGE